MHRTTIMLPPSLRARAQAFASKRGISVGELIREALETTLHEAKSVNKSDPFLMINISLMGLSPLTFLQILTSIYMAIFIDSGAFLARYLVKDQHHKSAVAKWVKLQKSSSKLYTSNFILDELITLLGRWVNEDFALEKAYSIYQSDLFTILRPEESDELHALDFYKKFSDHKIGFTDCVSFALMKRHKIQDVFSFDRHFSDVGFSKY